MNKIFFSLAFFLLCSNSLLGQTNVGVGTSTPTEKLDVVGNIKSDTLKTAVLKVSGTVPGAGKVLTSDATGNASWQTPAAGGGSLSGNGTANYIPMYASTTSLTPSPLYYSASGLGIGTTTPNAPLQFANTTAMKKIVLYEAANDDHQIMGFGYNNSTLRYQLPMVNTNHVFFAGTSSTTSNELMRIQGDGRVSINNPYPALGIKLDVNGSILASTGNITAASGNIVATSGNIIASTGNIIATTGDITATAGDVTATAGDFKINSSTGKLIFPSLTGSSKKIVLWDAGVSPNDHQYYGFGITGGITRYQVSATANSHVFYAATSATSSNELMRIMGNGKVGIGTSAPSANAMLDVLGSIRTSTGNVIIDSGEINFANNVGNKKVVLWESAANDHQFYGFGINSGLVRYQIPATTTSHVFYAATSSTASTELMRITGTGRLGIGVAAPLNQLQLSTNDAAKPTSSTWTISSDARLKTIDGSYTKGLAEILKLNTVKYHYKPNNERNLPTNEQGYGFVAQELQAVFPEAVKEQEDGYLSVDIHPVLISYINAIKELNIKNEKLQSQIDVLNKQNEEILKSIQQLSAKK